LIWLAGKRRNLGICIALELIFEHGMDGGQYWEAGYMAVFGWREKIIGKLKRY